MIGETLGEKYTLCELLGRGGMGSVFRAEHVESGELVAIKILHRHLVEGGGEALARFHRETRAASTISGEHLVRVIEGGTCASTGCVYLVTEHLEGEDLQRTLDRLGAIAPEGALRIAAQASLGLADAHAAGVIHRDIKPANIFLARSPTVTVVKILDFGIAKLEDPLAMSHGGLTTTGGLLGSPLYMSPEQVRSSRDVDHRTDLWALGCVLYAMLAGRSPYEHHASVGQVLLAICTRPPPPLADVAPWIRPEIAAVVHRALSLRADERFASARAMHDDLSRLVAGAAITAELVVSSGERAREITISTIPPPEVRGDAPTELATGKSLGRDDTLPVSSGTARSGVPAIGKKGAKLVMVDARPMLGDDTELWTFSLDVHRHAGSLIGRVFKSLRRAGAKISPASYGTEWVLVEARTGRRIADADPDSGERLTLDAAGIRPSMVLLIEAPDRPRSTH